MVRYLTWVQAIKIYILDDVNFLRIRRDLIKIKNFSSQILDARLISRALSIKFLSVEETTARDRHMLHSQSTTEEWSHLCTWGFSRPTTMLSWKLVNQRVYFPFFLLLQFPTYSQIVKTPTNFKILMKHNSVKVFMAFFLSYCLI